MTGSGTTRRFHPTLRCNRNQSIASTYPCVIALDEGTALTFKRNMGGSDAESVPDLGVRERSFDLQKVERFFQFEGLHPPLIGRWRMKFVLVNGRTPRPQSFCTMCCEPIGESYLREIETRLSYCDHKCYLGRCMGTVPALQYHARAS